MDKISWPIRDISGGTDEAATKRNFKRKDTGAGVMLKTFNDLLSHFQHRGIAKTTTVAGLVDSTAFAGQPWRWGAHTLPCHAVSRMDSRCEGVGEWHGIEDENGSGMQVL